MHAWEVGVGDTVRVMRVSPSCVGDTVVTDNATSGDSLLWSARILVILWGSLRGSPESWSSLSSLLFDRLNTTLMLVLPEPLTVALERESAYSTRLDAFRGLLWRRASHVVPVPEPSNWATELDRITPSWRGRNITCPQTSWETNPLGGVSDVACRVSRCAMCATRAAMRAACPMCTNVTSLDRWAGSAAIVGMYRWHAKRALLGRGLLDFDWFLYARTDSMLLCALRLPSERFLAGQPKTAGGVAIAPQGEDWGGLTDRMLVASRAAILPALTTLERWAVGNASLASNAETQLRMSLHAACVRVLRVPRTTFVVQQTPPARGTLQYNVCDSVRSNAAHTVGGRMLNDAIDRH